MSCKMKLYNISRCKVCNMRGQQAGENLWKYGICDACETYYPQSEPELQLHQERLSECCAMNLIIFNQSTGRWDFASNPSPMICKADRSWKNA